jgi:anti-sigma regulatory factor (Ser/Thr protein kinase)
VAIRRYLGGVTIVSPQVPARERPAFHHEAFLYGSRDEFLDGLTTFLRDGIATGAPALVVLDSGKCEQLRSALGADAGAVQFADMDAVGANPARIIPAWTDFVSRHERHPRLLGIGEPISARRDPDALAECHIHESLLNVAFAGAAGFELLCPYDTEALRPEVVAHARRTHPIVGSHGSAAYCRHDGIEAGPLPAPPAGAGEIAFDHHSLATVRHFVSGHIRAARIDDARAADLLLAINEITTNSVRHGGGGGRVRMWSREDRLICEVADAGSITDPLVGRRRPEPDQTGGYGIWIANQVCDLVQIRSASRSTTVRLHLLTT